jgi:DNA-nicking Smr family endonuclease
MDPGRLNPGSHPAMSHLRFCLGSRPVKKMEPIRIPIEDVLDLHSFRPQDIADLLEDYFDECLKAGILSVRVIHGKGKGIQKRQVHRILQKIQGCTS